MKEFLGGNSLHLFFTVLLCQRFQGGFNSCLMFLCLEHDMEMLVSLTRPCVHCTQASYVFLSRSISHLLFKKDFI